MSLEKEGTAILINLHELMLQPSTLVSLLELHSCPKKVSKSNIPVQPTICSSNSGQSSAPRTPKHIGHPSVVSKYPSIVMVVTEFLKQHGYRAHERRRSEMGTSCGVTLHEIRGAFDARNSSVATMKHWDHHYCLLDVSAILWTLVC